MDDQELDGLYARLRDAEDARKAAVGVIQRQNEALAALKADLLRYKVTADKDVCPGCMLREEQRESMQNVARETGLKLLQVKESATHWMERAETAEAVLARVRALHAQAAGAANPWCGRCHDVAPCSTVQALDA